MVAKTNQMRRLFRLMTHTLDLVADEKRDPEAVVRTLQAIKEDPDFAAKFFAAAPAVAVTLGTAQEQMARLVPLYKKLFGFNFNPEEVHVPERREGFNRLIVASDELRLNRIIEGLRKRMKVWTYDKDLDTVVKRASYIKRPNGAYVLLVRESQEADEDQKNKSARDLEKQKINCLTLEERLLYEAIYFAETNSHLDVRNWTLCTASRDSYGIVPRVSWNPDFGEVYVCWAPPGDLRNGLRARLAVS